MGVRLGVGVVGLSESFLDLAGHPRIFFRPQRLLHAQRRLPKQVQQAEQPHVIGGDDVLSNPLLDHLAGPMRLWRRRALVAGWEFCFFSDSRPSDSRWTGSFAHPLAQQTLFQGGALLRIASLVVGNAIRRGGLALDGPVGAAILTHRPDVADLVFQ